MRWGSPCEPPGRRLRGGPWGGARGPRHVPDGGGFGSPPQRGFRPGVRGGRRRGHLPTATVLGLSLVRPGRPNGSDKEAAFRDDVSLCAHTAFDLEPDSL